MNYTLENFISFCDDIEIAEEGILCDFKPTKYDNEKTINYLERVKKDKNTLISEINKASKLTFSELKKDSTWNIEYSQFFEDNTTAPKVESFDRESTWIQVYLGGKYTDDDLVLFYQDEVLKRINENQKLKSLNYKFDTEDYPGIFIEDK